MKDIQYTNAYSACVGYPCRLVTSNS